MGTERDSERERKTPKGCWEVQVGLSEGREDEHLMKRYKENSRAAYLRVKKDKDIMKLFHRTATW